MSCSKRGLLVLALATLPASILGCGTKSNDGEDPELARRKSELKQIYEIYTVYLKDKLGNPPKQPSDLAQKKYEMVHEGAFRSLQSGDVVFVYDVAKDSGKVLAYEKNAPKEGGFVLMADGSVKEMPADALQSALGTKP